MENSFDVLKDGRVLKYIRKVVRQLLFSVMHLCFVVHRQNERGQGAKGSSQGDQFNIIFRSGEIKRKGTKQLAKAVFGAQLTTQTFWVLKMTVYFKKKERQKPYTNPFLSINIPECHIHRLSMILLYDVQYKVISTQDPFLCTKYVLYLVRSPPTWEKDFAYIPKNICTEIKLWEQ